MLSDTAFGLELRRLRPALEEKQRRVAGAMLWSVVITLLGYLFGQSLPLLVKWVGRSGTILLIAAVVSAIIVWRIRKFRRSND